MTEYDEQYKEWLSALKVLWQVYGKQPDTVQLLAYAKVLGDLPLGILERAIQRTIKAHKYANVPTAAEVWASAMQELGTKGDPAAAIEQWIENGIERCIVDFSRSTP